MLITAKIQKPIERISQCDIFKDVDVVEYVKETEGKVIVSTLHCRYKIIVFEIEKQI